MLWLIAEKKNISENVIVYLLHVLLIENYYHDLVLKIKFQLTLASINSPFPSLHCWYKMNATPPCNANVHKKVKCDWE